MSNYRRVGIEQKVLLAQQQEIQRSEWLQSIKHDENLKSAIVAENKVPNQRRLRQLREIEQERALERELLEKAKLQAERELAYAEQSRKEEASEKERLENLRLEKIRQVIRQNSPELRELQQKLHSAYASKERALQIQEKELIRKQQRQAEIKLINDMIAQIDASDVSAAAKEREARHRAEEYKTELETQLADNESRKAEQIAQFLKEKAMIDEMVRRVQEEDLREEQKRVAAIQATRQYAQEDAVDRARWRELERARQEEENRKISEYVATQHAKDEARKERQRALEAAKDLIYQRVANEMALKERSKDEIENLRIELHLQEQEEHERKKEQQLLEKRIKQRLELLDAYRDHLAEKKRLIQKEREDETVFRERLLQKFAEDERLEQLNAQKQRMKKLEHKRAVDEILAERRRVQAQEKLEEEQVLAKERELEVYRRQVIEQERQRLLREHAGQLIGYLPKGVILSEKDIDLFDEDFRKKFDSMRLAK